MKSVYSCEHLARETRYAYIVGRIKAREALLFKSSTYEHLIAASRADEALGIVLSTKAYQSRASAVKSVLDVDILSRETLSDLRLLCKEYASEDELLRLIFIRHDLRNIAVAFREKITGEDYTSHYRAYAPLGRKDAKTITKKKDATPYEQRLIVIAKAAQALYAKTHDFFAYECAMDRGFLEALSEVATRHRLDFVREYGALYSDHYNLMLFLRRGMLFKNGTYSKETLEACVAGGGHIEKAFFARACMRDDMESVKKEFTWHHPDFTIDMRYFNRDKESLWKIERDCLRERIRYIAQSRLVSFGFEPVFGFSVLQEQELYNIAFIIVAKRHGAREEAIRERLVYA